MEDRNVEYEPLPYPINPAPNLPQDPRNLNAELAQFTTVLSNGETLVYDYYRYYREEEPEFVSLPSDPIAIARLIVCPNCKELTRPPIHDCSRGHSICTPCRLKSSILCPIPQCGCPMTRSRNWAIEKIWRATEFYCFLGCGQSFKGDDLLGHMETCARERNQKASQTNESELDPVSRFTVGVQTVDNGIEYQIDQPAPPTVIHPSIYEDISEDSETDSGVFEIGVELFIPQIPTPVPAQSLVSWIPCTNGQIPERAIYGGAIRMVPGGSLEKIYIIRASHSMKMYGGRLIVSEGGAYVYGNVPRAIRENDFGLNPEQQREYKPFRKWFYEVLTIPNPTATITWKDSPGPFHPIPHNALTFQNQSRNGRQDELAYIARLKIELVGFGHGYVHGRAGRRRQRQNESTGAVGNGNAEAGAEAVNINDHSSDPNFLYIPGYYLPSVGCIIGNPRKQRSETFIRNTGIQFLVVNLE